MSLSPTMRLNKLLVSEHLKLEDLKLVCANCGNTGRWVIGWSYERWFIECRSCARRWDGLQLEDARDALVADATLRALARDSKPEDLKVAYSTAEHSVAPFWRPGKVRAG